MPKGTIIFMKNWWKSKRYLHIACVKRPVYCKTLNSIISLEIFVYKYPQSGDYQFMAWYSTLCTHEKMMGWGRRKKAFIMDITAKKNALIHLE